MSAGASNTIFVREMTTEAADLDAFANTFAQSGSRERTRQSLEWQYVRNGSGRLYVDVAEARESTDAFAAVYATLPRHFRVGSTQQLGLQSLDTLTASAYRGRGLFLQLARKTYERAAAGGAALVYGFPNGSSSHGFFKKLDWVSLDPVPFLLRPLSVRYAADRLRLPPRLVDALPRVGLRNPLGGLLGSADVTVLERADERVTRLWSRFVTRVGVAVERNADYLQWRLFDKPDECYRTIALERGDELSALCSYTVKDKHGGRIGYVMELLCDPSLHGLHAASRLLGTAVRAMVADGAESALAWCFNHSLTFPIFVRHLFAPLPMKMRPIELHFGARALDRSKAQIVGQRSAWYISYLDSDTV